MNSSKEVVPQNASVVPLERTSYEQMALTADEIAAINSLTLPYMKRHKIAYDRDRRTLVQGVLIDALQKGKTLADSSKKMPAPRKLIEAGLSNREQSLEAASSVIEQTLQIPTVDRVGEHIGPLALPIKILSAAQADARNFHLRPNVSNVDNLLVEVSERTVALKDAVSFGLSIRGQATIEEFKDAASQAKIARNMLFSYATRGTPEPTFSTQEFSSYMKDEKSLEDLFTPDLVENLSQLIISNTRGKKESVHALLSSYIAQIKSGSQFVMEQLSRRLSTIDRNDPEQVTEQFYILFSQLYSLSDPALEAKRMEIDASHAKDAALSVWDEELSVVLNNYRIPTLQTLLHVYEQERKARRPTDWIRRAMRAWRDFRRATYREQEILQRLPIEIVENKKQIDEFEALGIFAVPSRSFRLIAYRGTYSISSREYIGSRDIYNQYQEYICRAHVQNLAKDNLLAGMANNELYERDKTALSEDYKGTALPYKLLQAGSQLRNIYEYYFLNVLNNRHYERINFFEYLRIPKERILEQISELEQMLKEHPNKEEVYAQLGINPDTVKETIEKYGAMVKLTLSPYGEKLNEYFGQLKEIMEKIVASGDPDETALSLFEISIGHKIFTLRELIKLKDRIDSLSRDAFLLYSPEKMHQVIQNFNIMGFVVSPKNTDSLDRYIADFERFRGIFGDVAVRKKFQIDLHRAIVDDRIPQAYKSRKEKRRQTYIRFQRYLRKIVKHRSFPLHDLNGVTSAKMSSALDRRYMIMRVNQEIESRYSEYRDSQDKYVKVASFLYNMELQDRKAKLEKRKEKYEESYPAVNAFIDIMKELKMAIPDEQENSEEKEES